MRRRRVSNQQCPASESATLPTAPLDVPIEQQVYIYLLGRLCTAYDRLHRKMSPTVR